MQRRDFGKTSLGLLGATLLAGHSEAVGAEVARAEGKASEGEASVPAVDFPKTPGLTQYVGQFVLQTKYESIPAEVIELGKKSILDGFGLALAGSRAESGPISRKYIEQCGGNGKATVIGTVMKTSPRFAALLNGISIHADDFDDTQLAAAKDRVYGLLMHPTVPVLPAIFALAEQQPVSGKEWLLAYQIGVEVSCKIAEAISPRHYQDGFHTTGTCGPFGSAAACAKLLKFDLGKTLNSFGLAGSQSGGLRENFGTMTKPLQAGHAAESGLVSAEMVALGWTAAEQILEADRGFFHAAGGSYDPSAIMNRLGQPWTFANPGVSLKPYPSGSLTHPAMTELARLIAVNNIEAAQVEKVDVGANHNMTTTLLHHNPKTGLEAKFSMEFCIAILLLERKAGLGQFSDKVVQRKDVREMIRKINFYVDSQAESAGFDKMTSILKITLKNGKFITGQAAFGKGSPSNPMSFDEASEKFRGCAEFTEWPKAKTEKIIAFVKELDSAPDMSVLTPLLSLAAAG
jgi:2-methylcitrate dehydratase PrpD